MVERSVFEVKKAKRSNEIDYGLTSLSRKKADAELTPYCLLFSEESFMSPSTTPGNDENAMYSNLSGC